MAKNRSDGGSSKSGSSSAGKTGSSSGGVSPARLHQKSGSDNSFGGYTKDSKPDGTFRMRKSGK